MTPTIKQKDLPTWQAEQGNADVLREILAAIRDQSRMLTTIGAHLAKLVTISEKQGGR